MHGVWVRERDVRATSETRLLAAFQPAAGYSTYK